MKSQAEVEVIASKLAANQVRRGQIKRRSAALRTELAKLEAEDVQLSTDHLTLLRKFDAAAALP